MKVPKLIADKIEQYEKHKNIADDLEKEIEKWFDEFDNDGGVYKGNYRITDHVTGREQSDGCYCDQWEIGCTGDSFEGIYYIPIEGSNKFVAYNYDC